MILFKACGKCGGDIEFTKDEDYKFLTERPGELFIAHCLQCGSERSIFVRKQISEVV